LPFTRNLVSADVAISTAFPSLSSTVITLPSTAITLPRTLSDSSSGTRITIRAANAPSPVKRPLAAIVSPTSMSASENCGLSFARYFVCAPVCTTIDPRYRVSSLRAAPSIAVTSPATIAPRRPSRPNGFGPSACARPMPPKASSPTNSPINKVVCFILTSVSLPCLFIETR